MALAGFLIYLVVAGLTGGESKEVPRVVGKQLIEARQILERAASRWPSRAHRARRPSTRSSTRTPTRTRRPTTGSTVTLEVSEGPGTVRVPTVAGQPQAVAIETLKKQRFEVNVDQRASSTVKKGIAIRTIPAAGEMVNVGERIQLYVSSGPAQVKVPDVTGLARDSAEQLLTDAGLEPAVEETESEQPEDEVISQNPAAGIEVDKGSRVTITVSKGIPTVSVPDVHGRSRRDAVAQLRAAGLVPAVREQDVTDPAQDGVVIDERPGAGTQLAKGSRW